MASPKKRVQGHGGWLWSGKPGTPGGPRRRLAKPGRIGRQDETTAGTATLNAAFEHFDRHRGELKNSNVANIAKGVVDRARDDPALAAQLDVIADVCAPNIAEAKRQGYLPKQKELQTPRALAAAYVAARTQLTWADSATDTKPESLAMHIWASKRFGSHLPAGLMQPGEAVPLEVPPELLADAGKNVEVHGPGWKYGADWFEKLAWHEQAPFMTKKPTYSEGYSGKRYARKKASVREVSEWIADQPVMKAVCEQTYLNTQEYLHTAGIDRVQVYRGVSFHDKKHRVAANLDAIPADGEDRPVRMNPLSSFALTTREAMPFAGYDRGVMLTADIPAERIYSLSVTGPGCVNEDEIIVVGSSTADRMHVRKAGEVEMDSELPGHVNAKVELAKAKLKTPGPFNQQILWALEDQGWKVLPGGYIAKHDSTGKDPGDFYYELDSIVDDVNDGVVFTKPKKKKPTPTAKAMADKLTPLFLTKAQLKKQQEAELSAHKAVHPTNEGTAPVTDMGVILGDVPDLLSPGWVDDKEDWMMTVQDFKADHPGQQIYAHPEDPYSLYTQDQMVTVPYYVAQYLQQNYSIPLFDGTYVPLPELTLTAMQAAVEESGWGGPMADILGPKLPAQMMSTLKVLGWHSQMVYGGVNAEGYAPGVPWPVILQVAKDEGITLTKDEVDDLKVMNPSK